MGTTAGGAFVGGYAMGKQSVVQRAATQAMASVVHKHGKSGCLGPDSGLATAKAAGLTGVAALGSPAGVAAVVG